MNGELLRRSKPNLRHQEIVGNLSSLLYDFVRQNNLGDVFGVPVDVVLNDDLVEPDIVFVSNEGKEIMSRERITGAPDLVVEVLSLSTSAYDLRYKWELYARSGVSIG